VDAIHFAPAEGDVRQRIRTFDPAAGGNLGELLAEAEQILPPDDADFEPLLRRVAHRWTLDELPGGAEISGTAFGGGPVEGALGAQDPTVGFQGRAFLNSYHGGDAATGRVALPEIVLPWDPISVLVGGGRDCLRTFVGIEVRGRVVYRACGRGDERLRPALLKTGDHAGAMGRVVIVDQSSGEWGHVLADDIVVLR
jgi:hypothetical protein